MRVFLKSQSNALSTPLDKHPLNGMDYFNKMASMIEGAGATGFAGLTGWRASEYGFSLSNIDIVTNPDPLDNQYTPWRFHVRCESTRVS